MEVFLRLDSWRPPPGQEWIRQFTVTASDGYTTVDTSGSLVQASSPAATATVTAPRPESGQQVERPFTIVASDGESEAQAQDSLIKSSAERGPLARLLLTLFGALAMILGVLSRGGSE